MAADRLRWYLAGKIRECDDWRAGIVAGIEETAREWREGIGDKARFDMRLPVLEDAVWGTKGWDYVGPYFAYDMGHSGDPHARFIEGYGVGEHGDIAPDKHCWESERVIHELCLRAVTECDILFAWIDDSDCYGTMIEVGYAAAMNKRIVVAFDPVIEKLRLGARRDMWFLEQCSTERYCDMDRCGTAREAMLYLEHAWRLHRVAEEYRKLIEEAREQLSQEKAARLAPASPALPEMRLDPQRAFSKLQKREIYLRSNGHCVGCARPLKSDWHADHVYPHSRGGRTEISNGQALCPGCNSRKHAKVLTVEE